MKIFIIDKRNLSSKDQGIPLDNTSQQTEALWFKANHVKHMLPVFFINQSIECDVQFVFFLF